MRLKYFQSIDVPDEMADTFNGIEDVLQRQHQSDGTHPLAASGSDGFMSMEDKRRLDILYDFFLKNNG